MRRVVGKILIASIILALVMFLGTNLLDGKKISKDTGDKNNQKINKEYLGKNIETPIIKFDDTKIVLTKTTLKDLLNCGYTYEWGKVYKPQYILKSRSYTSKIMYIKKNEKNYALISLANFTENDKKIENCSILEMDIKYGEVQNNYVYAKILETISRNSTIEDIKSKFCMKPSTEIISDKGMSFITYKDGVFEYDFTFDEDEMIHEVNIKANSNKL